jgi:hypothetical protein
MTDTWPITVLHMGDLAPMVSLRAFESGVDPPVDRGMGLILRCRGKRSYLRRQM